MAKRPIQDGGTLPREARLQIDDAVPPIGDLNVLDQYGVEDRVKIIISQGRHPDPSEKKKDDNSRSAWLFDALCNLVRAEVPDPVILSLIADRNWGISESVLDKGSSWRKYALRQIERAHEQAEDPRLRELVFWLTPHCSAICLTVKNVGGRGLADDAVVIII